MVEVIYDKGRKCLMPQCPDEMTQAQLTGVAEMLHSGRNALVVKLGVLFYLSGLNAMQWTFVSSQQRYDMLESGLIDWVFEPWDFTKQLIPGYNKKYGPESEFDNLTLAEFYYTEKYYQAHIQKEPDALDKLVAVLYRDAKINYDIEKNPEGDIREEFKYGLIRYNQQQVAAWPLKVKQAICLWYAGCRRKITALYADLFSGDGDGGGDGDMFSIIRNLSGGRYGTFDKVEQLNLHTALREMEMVQKENEQMEAAGK